MTKKLSEAFFGDKKLTEVFFYVNRKSTISIRRKESFRVQTLKSFSNPTPANSHLFRIAITMYFFSNSLNSLCKVLFRSLNIGNSKSSAP